MRGVITKGIAGFYYVWAEGRIYECKARGKFRKRGLTPLVGDAVEVFEDTASAASDRSMLAGTVDRILPRKNEFDRPPIANVDCIVIVAAAKDPEPLTYIIDRMAVSAELKDTEIIICVNKIDKAADIEILKDAYKGVYKLVCVSAVTGEGIDTLKSLLSGKQAALSGPSGVGKSSLTNALLGSVYGDDGLVGGRDPVAEVGDISEKTLRGKNTTRHSELFKGDGFFLFDTPGFTSFEAPEMSETDLALYFPEFENYLGKCRFDNCQHINEPDCAVKNALTEGKVSASRYDSYKTIYKELKERKKY